MPVSGLYTRLMSPTRVFRAVLVTALVALIFPAAMPIGEHGVAQAHPPPFFWMADLSSDRRIGMDAALGTSDLGVDAAPIVAASVFGEIALNRYLTAVGRVPFVYAQYALLDAPEDESSALALGNAGLGIKLVAGSERRSSALRYGLEAYAHLPTASDGADEGPSLLAGAALTTPDVGRYAIDVTTLRLRGSARYETGRAFFQGELGLEHQLNDSRDDTTDLLVGLGAGITLSPYLAILSELALVSELRDDDDDRELFPSLDIGMRYHDPRVMAGVRVHLPFAEQFRDANVLAFALDVAVRF